MTKILISARDVSEARIALAGGAHIIDLKEPALGALGAVPMGVVAEVVSALKGQAPISATIGDQPLDPKRVAESCEHWARLGVDYVKIGLFEGDLSGTLRALAPLIANGVRLVAVLFADRNPDWRRVVPQLAEARFAGAMLDTMGKQHGGLRDHMGRDELASFTAAVQHPGLLCGLAGSLSLDDIAPLAELAPDYLGFRGGVSDGGRTGALSLARVMRAKELADRTVADGVGDDDV